MASWPSHAAVLALLLASMDAPAAHGAQAPCLEGRRGRTASEILRDDWACYTFCRNQEKLSATCDLCCPNWLGGSGNSVPVDEGAEPPRPEDVPPGGSSSTTAAATASAATSSTGGADGMTKAAGSTTTKAPKSSKQPPDSGSSEAADAGSSTDTPSSTAAEAAAGE